MPNTHKWIAASERPLKPYQYTQLRRLTLQLQENIQRIKDELAKLRSDAPAGNVRR